MANATLKRGTPSTLQKYGRIEKTKMQPLDLCLPSRQSCMYSSVKLAVYYNRIRQHHKRQSEL
jgi:hypothetical protein